jgi:hypothetical protein
MADLRTTQRQLRETRKAFLRLTLAVRVCTTALDVEMMQPSTEERGKRVAKITNALELENDIARRYGLGLKK